MAYIDRSLENTRFSHAKYQPFAFPTDHTIYPSSQINSRGSAMTLVKDDLVQTLHDQAGLSKHQSRAAIERVFELIKKALESGEDVLISGFGKFIVKEKATRRGRNPATGEDLTLDPRRVITFKCSPRMRDRIDV
jgi:integration host factor subunit alpha